MKLFAEISHSQFARSGIQLSPLVMPLSGQVHQFPELPRTTFHGLPGLLADSLPDKFGNALIDAWLATQGRLPESFSAVERLCYTGTRGMGALEFSPVLGPKPRKASKLQVDGLVRLAGEGATLIVTVDCGAMAHQALAMAHDAGIDVIVVDQDGAVLIPAAMLDEITTAAFEQERQETWIMSQVQAGAALPGLYPPNAENQARYAAWVKTQD